MLDVLLIKPPRNIDVATHGSLPMSLAYLAGSLRTCFSVDILDMQFLPFEASTATEPEWLQPLVQDIKIKRPLVVGITCLFSGDIEKIVAIAPHIKGTSPETAVVVGGVHPTIYSREILEHCQDVDFVVKGEGDLTLVELVAAIKSGKTDFSSINGLAWRDGSGAIVEQKKSTYIENLDSLPRPAYDLFPMDKYTAVGTLPNPKSHAIRMNFPIITSRSCGRSCNFCSLHNAMGHKARGHSAQRVLDDLEYLYHTYGLNYFDIEDDNFTISKPRIMEICEGIKARNLDIQFRLRNGVYIPSLDDDVVDALAEAGLVMTYLAIESGSEYIRNKVIGKNVATEKIYSVAEAFARHPHITLGAFFIVGMPEETTQTAQDTVTMIERLPLDLFVFMPATPYPGTRLYNQCVRDGLFFLNPAEISELWRRLCRIEQTISAKSPIVIKPYDMSLDELQEHCRRLADMGSQVMYRSFQRREGETLARLQNAISSLGCIQGKQSVPLYIFGAGIYGRLGRRIAEKAGTGVAVAGFLDNNRDLWDTEIEGIRVYSPASIISPETRASVFVCILNRSDAANIATQLKTSGDKRTLLLPDYMQ